MTDLVEGGSTGGGDRGNTFEFLDHAGGIARSSRSRPSRGIPNLREFAVGEVIALPSSLTDYGDEIFYGGTFVAYGDAHRAEEWKSANSGAR